MKIYDTLTRRVKPLAVADEVKIYVCGLTVYDEMHLGHARSMVATDVLVRWLRAGDFKVKFVQNFTDVDDRIIERAQGEGVPFMEIADRYIALSNASAQALNLLAPDFAPRATAHIPQIVAMIAKLVELGYAYPSDSGVYFSVKAYLAKGGQYGELSRRAVEDMRAEADKGELGKRDAEDFALWKAHIEGEPSWDSPWGLGRPGWHIECSAMALAHLGEQFDIHGGGVDLLFPHHENELAQSQAALGVKPLVQFWFHNGLLNLPDGVKMSKSLGNSYFVRDVLKKHSADALRMWMCQSHYRSPLLLSEDSIVAAERSVQKLRECVELVPAPNAKELEFGEFWTRFVDALNDDLNTPMAVASLFELRRAISNEKSTANIKPAQKCLRQMCQILGLQLTAPKVENNQISDEAVEQLIKERNEARTERRFADADALRQKLLDAKIQLEDSPHGTTWKRII